MDVAALPGTAVADTAFIGYQVISRAKPRTLYKSDSSTLETAEKKNCSCPFRSVLVGLAWLGSVRFFGLSVLLDLVRMDGSGCNDSIFVLYSWYCFSSRKWRHI